MCAYICMKAKGKGKVLNLRRRLVNTRGKKKRFSRDSGGFEQEDRPVSGFISETVIYGRKRKTVIRLSRRLMAPVVYYSLCDALCSAIGG